jgi:hypothetical protein
MKVLNKFLLISLSALVLLSGCSKDKNNGGTNYNPFPPITPDGLTSVSYRGTVSIANRSLYRQLLEEVGYCSDWIINTCTWIDRNPVMALQFRGTEVDEQRGINGNVLIEVLPDNGYGSGAIPVATTFYPINDNSQLEAIAYGFAGTRSYNAEIVIIVTGEPGDTSLAVSLDYRGQHLGTVTLRKYQPTYPY